MPLRALPSVDRFLNGDGAGLVADYGRAPVTKAVRAELARLRDALRTGAAESPDLAAVLLAAVTQHLARVDAPRLRPVLNLTGTVLHTNLGRAILADEAIAAAKAAMSHPVALEYDLDTGKRGERDDHLRALLCELTGAEDATVVNNNAAAVLLTLEALGAGRQAIVSRGELIEIGGSFRIPDIMARAGVHLVEVGTTNRTHLRDYAQAITPDCAMILKVHPSNYRIEGFSAEVPAPDLAPLARTHGLWLVNDLGSGSLVDLSRYGLRREPTVAEAVAEGADIVTFSGDKLLGGPQAGFIVGRKAAIAAINASPLKRALRLDKIRIAALEATLRLYLDPDRLARRLPTLAALARPLDEIKAQAIRLAPDVARVLGCSVDPAPCDSQIGSGALPTDTLPSYGLRITTEHPKDLAAWLRARPMPIIGRIQDGALMLDLRCLDRDAVLLDALA